jgi:hypothetical protein
VPVAVVECCAGLIQRDFNFEVAGVQLVDPIKHAQHSALIGFEAGRHQKACLEVVGGLHEFLPRLTHPHYQEYSVVFNHSW